MFDNYEKKLSILKKGEKKEDEPLKNDSKFTVKIAWAVVLAVILAGLVFGIIGTILGKTFYGKRKKKANELDDGYDYQTSNEENKKKNLIIN